MDNIILVDTSYTSFYRFFATLRWLSLAEPEIYKQYKDDPSYEWLNNTIFMEKYEKMYLESIIKLITKKIFNKSTVIFCMDSPRENIWRSELCSSYKADREDLSKKNNFKPVFKYTYNTIIPNILEKHKNIHSIRINKLEADDIIAVISKYCENLKKNIYLISGDQDFLQLGRDNLYFTDYKTKKLKILTKDEGKKELHKKILLGDKSDCINTIFPKGMKKAIKDKLLESEKEFIEYIKSNKDINDKYEFNKSLIDFNCIPKKYEIMIIKEFELIINNKNI